MLSCKRPLSCPCHITSSSKPAMENFSHIKFPFMLSDFSLFLQEGPSPLMSSCDQVRFTEGNLPFLVNCTTEHDGGDIPSYSEVPPTSRFGELYMVWVLGDQLRILATTLGLPPPPNSTATSLPQPSCLLNLSSGIIYSVTIIVYFYGVISKSHAP